MFPSNEVAQERLEKLYWPGGFSPYCGPFNVQCNIKHKSRARRCRDCLNEPMFTVRVAEFFHRNNVCEQDTSNRMRWGVMRQMVGKCIKYAELIAYHGLAPGART